MATLKTLGPDSELWDGGVGGVTGFGARRQRSEAIAYILLYRTKEGRSRRFTIGRHGAPWAPETARREAKRLLGEIVTGADPAGQRRAARRAETVADLCDLYIADVEAGRLLTRRRTPKKPTTLLTDRSRIERHIKPLLGTRKVSAVTREDVERFMHEVAEGRTARRVETGRPRGLSNVRGGRGAATRTLGLLGAIFAYAEYKRMRPDNPVRGVIRYADGVRQQRLTPHDYTLLGRGMKKGSAGHRGIPPITLAAVRFLTLTGWRSGEVLNLRWSMIDFGRHSARLAETKTGPSIRPLSKAASAVLRELGGGDPAALVFPSPRSGGVMNGFAGTVGRIVIVSGLPETVTPHVLRHSFASIASDLGYADSTIAGLLGHKTHSMTSRYIHAAERTLTDAADLIANHIAELMDRHDGSRADRSLEMGRNHPDI